MSDKVLVEVIGIRFKSVGKIYYFSPNGIKVEQGASVIVETARGIEYGKVELSNRMEEMKEAMLPLKPLIRIATEADEAQYKANKDEESKVLDICNEKIRVHNLDMKLVDAEYTFDRSKVLFYFTADGRIDFRDLVKDLATVFRTRIELRQIGVRDEAKTLNGIGICGRTLCCATFLGEFQPVSIKMAKEQSLSLNPTKISGVCGRLMCCLKYEEEAYEELKSNLPNVGDHVSTPDGDGEVIAVNTLRQLVKVVIKKSTTTDLNYYNVSEIKLTRGRKHKNEKEVIDKELLKLEDK